jgi:hypothetical protein
VNHWGSDKARSLKPDVKYKLPRGGILVQGLVPEYVLALHSELGCSLTRFRLGFDYDYCEAENDDSVDIENDVASV